MTKKVTQNVTNSNSEDLTDKLKKGKLPDNHHYYYRLLKGTYEVGNTFCLETLRYCKGGDKIEVIAEVPSYEEWFNQGDYVAFLEEENKNLKEELQNQAFILKSRESEIVKLKGLLKDCVEYVKRDYGDYLTYTQSAIYQEINQVLADNQIQANTVACNKIQENK